MLRRDNAIELAFLMRIMRAPVGREVGGGVTFMIHGVERPPGLGTVHCQEDLRGHQAAVSRSTTRRPSVRIVVTFQVQVRSQPAPESDSS